VRGGGYHKTHFSSRKVAYSARREPGSVPAIELKVLDADRLHALEEEGVREAAASDLRSSGIFSPPHRHDRLAARIALAAAEPRFQVEHVNSTALGYQEQPF
jgi:hypothetical protein